MSLLVNQEGHPKSAFLPNEPSSLARFPAPPQSRPPEQPGPSMSAFRAVGSQLKVNSPAVRPATSPLTRSPDMGRHRRDSSDQDTVSPTPSSTDGESQPPTPVVPGPPQGRDAFSWPSHSTYDENRQLLGTEEESSERQSSDDEEEKNIWLITKEQLNYYVTQFRSMQPNPHGVIPGAQAKEFFEKSRLPIQELRKIWQLSDVTKDGCLSLEEFLTAMHLVVLRRNDIPLPDELPMCLRPLNLKHGVIDRHNKDLYTGHQNPLLEHETEAILDRTAEKDKSIISLDTDMSPESQMSSPGGPKPVKFDFAAISAASDPSIACPVPLRLSPDSPYLQSSEEDSPKTIGRQPKSKKREVLYEQLWNVEDSHRHSSRHDSSSSEDDTEDDALEVLSSSHSNDSRISGSHGPVSLPYFSGEPRQVSNILGLQKKEGIPPSPPPRPGKSHTRSASLDLNHLNRRTTVPSLPSVPPRSSPFHRAGENHTDDTEDILNRDTKEISAGIHKFKESIALLTRTVTELGQEVSDTLEERVVLEYQLEQLKSIGNDDN